MKQLNVKVKRLYDDAQLPTYAHATDAGMDLYAHSKSFDKNGNAVYGTGIAVEIPEGYVGLVFPRSSIYKKQLNMCNSVGIIDNGFSGEITCKYSVRWANAFPKKLISLLHLFFGNDASTFSKYDKERKLKYVIHVTQDGTYEVGDRIAQLIIIPYPKLNLVEVEELQGGERGDKGYGSTGR